MKLRCAMAVLVSAIAAPAQARPKVTFGAFDVQTVFSIRKSDNRDEVQYALQLDERCRPRTREPVFGYWRVFEQGEPPPLLSFSWLDETAYGIVQQQISAPGPDGVSVVSVMIRAANKRVLELTPVPTPGGGCRVEVRATVFGQRALLQGIFVKLAPPFVEYVELRGVAVADGTSLVERVKP